VTTPFITHQPIVSKQGKVIASRLTLHLAGESDPSGAAAAALQASEEFWPMGQGAAIFLGFEGASPAPSLFDWMLPENATLEIPATALVGPDAAALIVAVKSSGASTCLAFDLQATAALQCGLNFRFIGLDASALTPAQMQAIAVKTKSVAGIALAMNVNSVPAYKATMEAGLAGASGWFCKQPSTTGSKDLSPAQAHIIRVLNLVRNNADVVQIEAALKQDVALSYRLLRYINSAGFGLSCEVQSFRHAVTILGYDKLNKWLSLLLASSSKDPMAPAMMHTALARARLMELLGQGAVGKSEIDNLFIIGAFSLLDTMLGVPLEKALEPMHLPDSITEALLTQSGPYAAFFQAAVAAESPRGEALAKAANDLGLTAEQTNTALLQAIGFASNMSL
jgi:EAL and modified HD-GYP domain-containing signal transduction protein